MHDVLVVKRGVVRPRVVGFAHDLGGRFTIDAFAGGDNLGNGRYYREEGHAQPTAPSLRLDAR